MTSGMAAPMQMICPKVVTATSVTALIMADLPSLRLSIARKQQKGAMQVETRSNNPLPVMSTQISLKALIKSRKYCIAPGA